MLQEMIAAVPEQTRKQYDYSEAIASRICRLMKEHGMSQRELARLTGKRPSDVTRWLTGSHNFTLATLATISTALGEDLVRVT